MSDIEEQAATYYDVIGMDKSKLTASQLEAIDTENQERAEYLKSKGVEL